MESEDNFCPSCGSILEPADQFCRKCGENLHKHTPLDQDHETEPVASVGTSSRIDGIKYFYYLGAVVGWLMASFGTFLLIMSSNNFRYRSVQINGDWTDEFPVLAILMDLLASLSIMGVGILIAIGCQRKIRGKSTRTRDGNIVRNLVIAVTIISVSLTIFLLAVTWSWQ